MLCDFDYHDQNILDSSLLSYRTNTTSLETKLKSPTLLQYVLTVWVFTIFCDEVRQVVIFMHAKLTHLKFILFFFS